MNQDHYLLKNHNGFYFNQGAFAFQGRLYATRMSKEAAKAAIKYLKAEHNLTAKLVKVAVKTGV